MAFGAGPALAQGSGASSGSSGGAGESDHKPPAGEGEGEGVGADAVVEGEGVDGAPIFVRLKPFMAPVIEKRRIKGYAQILLTLEVKDRESMAQVFKKLVPLRDEFLRDLQFQASMRGVNDPPFDLKRIKARFMVLADRVIGDGAVVAVLVQSALYNGT